MDSLMKCRYCKKVLPEDKFHTKKNGDKSNSCISCWEKHYLSKRDNPNYCNNCRCICDESDFGIKANGEVYKTCLRCRKVAIKSKEKNKCEHGKRKYLCRACGGISLCEHDRYRFQCRECGGSQICIHNIRRNDCKKCNDPVEITIKNWIKTCRQSDKKYDRFDADHFIDTDFLKGLVEDYPNCFYDDCRVELQYIDFESDLATIERLDNTKGHIKSNCVLACKSCNLKKKSNSKNKPDELADKLSDKLVLTSSQ